ncbi:MAG: hypothetical protein ABEI77_10400 [Halorientalis sp.]
MERLEEWTGVENGRLPLPDPVSELVTVEFPSDSTTFWSRLRYEEWPLFVLSSRALSDSQFERVDSTPVRDSTVSLPTGTLTNPEREQNDEKWPAFEGETGVALYAQGEMLTGECRSVYVLTFGQIGALRQVLVFLPTPN